MFGTLLAGDTDALEAMSPPERVRLVRLCARLSGSADAAEDLAQETLVEAWRNRHKLRDVRARGAWLAAIARHVCRRWARTRGRELTRLVRLDGLDGAEDSETPDPAADETDLERDLEREELVALLDRALALLPPETRGVLIARYAEELPEAEIAARLGVSAGAIAVRLHRGKLALRRVLATDLSQEAAAYGLTGSDSAGWRETRIWCPNCGRRRLLGHFNAAQGELILRCPGCSEEPGYYMLDHRICDGLFAGVKTYKPALNRVMQWADVYYRAGLAARMVRCARCGRPAPLRMGCPADSLRALHGESGIHVACGCGSLNFSTLGGMALYTPEGRQFWRAHPRIRTLPQREAEIAGHSAILVSYDSLTDHARLDVAFARDTLQIVGIHATPGA